MSKVIFIGPLPPPVNGFSNINALMLAQLQQVTEVIVFDRSPDAGVQSKPLRRIKAIATTTVQVIRFATAALRMPVNAVYAGFSGGMGQLLDLPFIAIARLAGIPIYLHHHSFAYINAPTRLTKICLAVAGDARQIVLCSAMGDQLARQYGLARSNITQVSNSGFMSADEGSTGPKTRVEPRRAAIRVGFLGNITAEKGIFKYIDVVCRGRALGLDVEGVIAGPVAHAIESRFTEVLARVRGFEYQGAVYGAEKQRFYDSIDLLLFPTNYVNEAEPVTIWEAMAAGVEVVATQRGCISDVIAPGCGDCASEPEFEATSMAAMTRLLALTLDARASQRAHIRNSFAASRTQSRGYLAKLVSNIAGAQFVQAD